MITLFYFAILDGTLQGQVIAKGPEAVTTPQTALGTTEADVLKVNMSKQL